MKKKLLAFAALTLGVCALVGCTRTTVSDLSGSTLPHQGETAADRDGSVYAVGETVTDRNGDARVAQPVTNADGELVGVTLMTPEEVSAQKALSAAEASYTGRTNRQRITTTVVRGTSPNRLTSRPTLPETEAKSVKLPETLPSYYVPETTLAPSKIKVNYPGTLSNHENGGTVKYQIDRYEVSAGNDGPVVTLAVKPLSALREPVIVQIGYNCYDVQGVRLNESTLFTPAALNPDGTATKALAPLPGDAVRVEFFGS